MCISDRSGLALPSWLAMSALEQLLPVQLRDALVARASCGSELATFPARLAWVKVQMEHARGLAQATAYAPSGGRGRDASGACPYTHLTLPTIYSV